MTILCGTDFSELGTSAARVAASFAARAKQPLLLAHVLGFPASERHAPVNKSLVEQIEGQLAAEAARLRQHQVRVSTQILFGNLAEALIGEACRAKAQLLVVGAHSREASSWWRIGQVTEELAATAGIPLLVVRADDALCAWATEERPLRVIVGADDSTTTDAAVRFVAALQALGPCEASAVHLFWPPVAFERLGLTGVRSFLELDPVVQQTLTEELGQRLGGIPVQVQPHLGNIGERLASIAAQSGADLIVVGSHGRNRAESLWQGSTSRDVLHKSKLSVAAIPLAWTAQAVRRFHRGLVATDFSERGNAALALAFAAVPPDGILDIVHVVPPRDTDIIEPRDIFVRAEGAPTAFLEVSARLTELGQRQAALTPCRFKVHVLESSHPAKAIVQAAERLHADFVCLSNSGKPAVTRLVLGSVARAVIEETRRPVLLAQG